MEMLSSSFGLRTRTSLLFDLLDLATDSSHDSVAVDVDGSDRQAQIIGHDLGGLRSTAVSQNASQVVSRNSSRTCSTAHSKSRRRYSRSKRAVSPPSGAGCRSRRRATSVSPVPQGVRRWAVNRLTIRFRAMRKSHPRNEPRDGSGSHRSIAPATARKTSCVRSAASASCSPPCRPRR